MDTSEKVQAVMDLTETKSQLPPDAHEKVNYIYINNTFLFGSNWDVRFVFAERLPSGAVVPRTGIVMSHQHAKALLGVLAENVKNIEALMGEIKYRPSTVQQEKGTEH